MAVNTFMTDSSKHYRAVVIGCGNRSRDHAAAYQHLPEAEIVACCAPTPTRREKLAGEFNLRAYEDAATMIRQEKPDLVHIVTWPNARLPLMRLVAEMDVPACTVEKPVATGVKDWNALHELLESDTKFAVCHQFRWQKDLVRCRQALQSGKLGAVRFLDFSAGMNVSGQGTHILNYAMSLNSDALVTQVFSAASGAVGMNDGHPAPDSSVGYLTFANGVRGLWNNGPTAPRCGDTATEWQHVRVAAYGERGNVLYEEFGRWEISAPDGVERGDFGGMSAWKSNNWQAQAAFHRAMLAWLENGTLPGTHLGQSLHEWKVVLALYASALERRPITIEDFTPDAALFEHLRVALSA
jgi:predicted dehydrogenase